MSNYVQFGPSLPGIGTDTKRLSSELRKFSFLPFLLIFQCHGFLLYLPLSFIVGGRRDRMVVGFKTTCAISAYHHKSCELI
jgi:hypothetical protein